MKFLYTVSVLIPLSLMVGCSSKINNLPKNVTKVQKITSLKQFNGCYLAEDNSAFITQVMNNTPYYYLNKKYKNIANKTYKICFKSKGNELLVASYQKNGKTLIKNDYTLGKDISISLNALVFDSNYNALKGSDAGLFIGPNYKRTYLTLNTNNDLIYSDNHFATGVAVLLFIPIPMYSNEQHSFLIRRIN